MCRSLNNSLGSHSIQCTFFSFLNEDTYKSVFLFNVPLSFHSIPLNSPSCLSFFFQPLSPSLASQITSFQSFLGSLFLFRRECTKSTLPSPMTIQGLCTFQTHAASFMSFNFVFSDRLHTFFFSSRREEIITKTVSRLENFPKNQVTRTELNSPVNFIIPLTISPFGIVVPKLFNERNEGNGL